MRILTGKKVIEENELIVSWQMIQICNFDCFYCYGHRPGPIGVVLSVKEVIGCLKRTSKNCSITLVGGEVFLIPNFVNICEQLIDAGIKISVETNLSLGSAITEFADRINPFKTGCIYISTHILEREKRNTKDEYIKNVILLKEKGFNVRVNYVLHPSLLSRFRGDYEFFETKGIDLLPRPFVGFHKGLAYPDSYSRKERTLILNADPHAGRRAPLNGTKGMLCNAGKSFIRITEYGKVNRCVGDDTCIGDIHQGINLFDSPRPCPNKTCPCWGWAFLADSKEQSKLEKKFSKPTLKSQIKRFVNS
ncbi:MAG: radical SAM protein [Candidatus Omnitrophota bacterium]